MNTRIVKSISYASGFYGKTFEEFIDFAVGCGFSGVQLIPDQTPNLYSELTVERIDKIREKLSKFNLKPSVHNVFYDINLCSLVPDVSDFARIVTQKVLTFANAINASSMTVHPGYMYPGWRNDPLQNQAFWLAAKNNLEKLVELGARFGVQVLLENGSYCLSARKHSSKIEFHIGIDIVELDKLLKLGGSEMGICMDIGKLRASGVNPRDFIDVFSNFICEVQVSNKQDLDYLDYLVKRSTSDLINVVFEGRDAHERKIFLNWH